MGKVLQCAPISNCKALQGPAKLWAVCICLRQICVMAADVDMCRQGDAQILGDWKKTHTIQMLKREVEQKGYSAVTVCEPASPPASSTLPAKTPCHLLRSATSPHSSTPG